MEAGSRGWQCRFPGHWGLLVSLAALTWSWRICSACPKQCACYLPTEVHCTFRYLSTIPENIQDQVERINLGYNNLMELTRHNFAGLKSLELLMLHSNKIQEIPDKAFQDLRSLQVLKMSYNKVKALNRETFHGLHNIVRLHMDHNSIEFINPETFYGLTSLKLLHLEGNMLQELHRDTFVTFRYSHIFKMSSLKHIYLSDNALTSIPSDLLSSIPEIESIYLHGNQWFCDCNLKWLSELNERQPGAIKCKRDRNYPSGQICPLCTTPSVSRGKDILQLPPSVFACVPPKIHSPLKIRNSTLQEEGDYAAINAKDFVAPLGQMSLNMSDQSGNGCEITCNVHRPLRTPQTALDQKEGYVLLNASFSTFLVCHVDYEQIQQLWGILALYTDSPLKLERDALLSKTPYMSYLYKQSAAMALHQFTDIEMQIRADPAWLMQEEITLQMDRTRTTLNVLQIKYHLDVQVRLKNLDVKPGKNSWVMIKKANGARTERFVVVGGTVELECQAIGDPKPVIEWILPDGSKVRAPYNSEDSRISISAGGKFLLKMADLYDTGIYHCVGTNYQDADVLSFRVTILDPSVAENYINGPYISKSGGDSIHFPCQATGIPNASISWVLPDHRVLQQTTGNKEITPNGTLKIQRLTARDSGYYRCLAANRYGIDLLALQLTVTGSRISSSEENAERNDAAEEDFGSGESEEDLLESEDWKEEPSQLPYQKSSEDEAYYSTTSSTLLTSQPRTSTAVLITPRRRINGSGSKMRWRSKRRRLKQPGMRVDPQHWAEYLKKVRKNVATKTATRKITVKPHVKDLSSDSSVNEGETSGDDLKDAEEEELLVVTTKQPTAVSSTRLFPVDERSTAMVPLSKSLPATPFHTTEPDTKAAVPPILKAVTEANLFPKAPKHIYKTEPIRVTSPRTTSTPHESKSTETNDELQVMASGNIMDTRYIPTTTPTALSTDISREDTSSVAYATEKTDPAVIPQSETASVRDYHTHITTITMAKEDGNQILLKTTQKITSPLSSSLSTILTQQIHIIREATTGAPVSKPRRFGWRGKFPSRRRFGRPGLRRHKYRIVRPGLRRPAQGRMAAPTLAHSEATSPNHMPSVTAVPARPPVPQPAPVLNGASTKVMQIHSHKSGDPGAGETATKHTRTSHKQGTQRVVVTTISSSSASLKSFEPQWVAWTDTGTQTPDSKTTTQLPKTISRTTYATEPLPKRPFHVGFPFTTAVTTAEPTTRSSKIVRGKIPWNRLFGVSNQKDVLRRLRKPIQSSTTTTAGPNVAIILTSTPRSVMTPQAAGDSNEPLFSTPNLKSYTVKPTTKPPIASTHPPSTTSLPITVTTIPFITETVSTTATTAQATRATRRMGFRRRRPSKISRTRHRAWQTMIRNRLVVSAAESMKTHTTKPRIPSPPTITTTTSAPLRVAISTGTTTDGVQSNKQLLSTAGVNPATLTNQYISRILHLPSNSLTSQPTVSTLATTNPLIPTSPISKTTSRGIITTMLQATITTKATRLSTIRKKIPPTKMAMAPPATETASATPTAAPSTESNVHSATVTATSTQSLTTAKVPARSVPRFRITLHKFTTPAPPRRMQTLPPTSRIDQSFRQNAHTRVISTLQTTGGIQWQTSPSSAEGQNKDRAASPNLDIDLENTIENKDDFPNKSKPSSSNAIAVGPMAGNLPSKPRLISGNTASFTVLADSDALIPCEATGNPTPFISWTKISTGATITAKAKRGNKFEVFPNGTLSIQKIKVQDRGQYLCTAANPHGSEQLLVTLSVVSYPSKILEPRMKDITVHAGYPVEMKCRSQGRPAPTISWILSNRTMVRNSSPFNGRVSVSADGALRIKAVTVYDRGNYRCVASNPAGIDTITVRMQVVAQPPAILEARHQSIKGQVGQNIRMACTALGTPPPTVHWTLFDGTEIKPLQFVNTKLFAFTNGTLYVKSLTPSDSGNYECIATSSTGSERRVVSLVVERKQEIPKIVSISASNTKVNYGDKLQLHCSATGKPKPKIIWRLPSKLVVDQWHGMASRVLVLPNGTLSIESMMGRDAGDYLCIARNAAGGDAMSLRIDVSMRPALIEHKRSTHHRYVSYGADLRVDCKASGSPEPRVSWILPDGTLVGKALQATGGRTRRYVVFGNGTLYYSKVGMAEEGDYTCHAQNTLGKDQMKVHVTIVTVAPRIEGPRQRSLRVESGDSGGEATLVVILEVTRRPRRPVFANPLNEKVITGAAAAVATLNCSADGHPPPEMLWTLPNGTRLTGALRVGRYQISNDGTFRIHSPTAQDAGKYRCAAKNEMGYIEKLIIVDIGEKPTIGNRPLGLIRSMSGDTLYLPCSASGSPTPKITWTAPSGKVLDRPQINTKYILFENGTLNIRETGLQDRGNYVCKAHNVAGVASVSVSVAVIAYPPRITNGPPKSVYAMAGSPVQLNCMAIGIPRPEIVWELPNHTLLSTYSKGRPTGSELLHPQGTLVIQRLSAKDSGTFKCTAKNKLGSDSRITYIQVI
ncbi:hypothetical protein scyTo_0002653 [Scyliorhinus torazame]|uniref:Ig-like domain-containing protein n=1 Tax=Scyliorhinus torazame TaxID=75743 RepID=A0A401PKC6_SCYTO|nr:hypothetical protein [Scyliorhinus torazame]